MHEWYPINFSTLVGPKQGFFIRKNGKKVRLSWFLHHENFFNCLMFKGGISPASKEFKKRNIARTKVKRDKTSQTALHCDSSLKTVMQFNL